MIRILQGLPRLAVQGSQLTVSLSRKQDARISQRSFKATAPMFMEINFADKIQSVIPNLFRHCVPFIVEGFTSALSRRENRDLYVFEMLIYTSESDDVNKLLL